MGVLTGRIHRLATTVHAYERRARTRATPQGAFAGVQVARVTENAARYSVGKNVLGHLLVQPPAAC
ncbi:lantibiotic dehydratase [Promicromonospora sp. NPDC057138]|uniref:lantibiotic dehydratase n=1 Tax=Promicromonospora sp. NPDC057138 TaxID=3346031 RepID=UPI00362D4B7F